MEVKILNICLISLSVCSPSTGETKPNIIFILTDDQGYADVGFTNPDSRFVTSNIDGLAEEAVRLDNYYVHPTCSPTRAALMTGRYSVNVGVSFAFVPGNPGGLDSSINTLPNQLSGMGYTNYLVGKWHLGTSKASYHPLRRGFDHFYGLLGGGINFFTKQCGSGRYDFWRDFQPEYEHETHATGLFNQEALNIIEKHALMPEEENNPFFMYLAHPAPHDPLLPTKRMEKLCIHIKNKQRRLTCALVAGIDEGVGQIRDLLTKHGMLDNTIIIFSSDNGGVPYAGALNYPLRGSKATAWEGGVRSPGFIYSPSLLPGGGRPFSGLFHVVDFLPTLVSMIDTAARNQNSTAIIGSETLNGVDQFESLENPQSKGVRNTVHIHRDLLMDSHVYRKGAWKIIVGHHTIPFLFPKIYNETTSRWLMDGGSWRGMILESICNVLDLVVGEENALFVKYAIWFLFQSPDFGGLAKLRESRSWMGFSDSSEILSPSFPSDLNLWRLRHTEEYPTVSLFNLIDDPQERTNLAKQYPKLVEEMLIEAEKVVKDAPPALNGGLVDVNAETGPSAGTWYENLLTLGTSHPKDKLVPFGPYLKEDLDISTLTYTKGFTGKMDNYIMVIFLKIFLTIAIVPLILMLVLFKFCRK